MVKYILNCCNTGVTPSHIVRYFKWKAYGKNPDEICESDRPTAARAASLENYKKAYSYFSPRKNLKWDEITAVGNPTKSIEVNSCINSIKKFEGRQQGKPSNAKRPLAIEEFMSLLGVFRDKEDMESFITAAYSVVMFNICGRPDCVSNMQTTVFTKNEEFDFTIHFQMNWAKNIYEENQCGKQVMLGAMDERLCVFIAVGVYLGLMGRYLQQFGVPWGSLVDKIIYIEEEPYEQNKLFRLDMHTVIPDSLKETMSTAISNGYCDPKFTRTISSNKLGTYSIRKCASNHLSRCGVSLDHIEGRGRWKGINSRRVVIRYIDNTNPFPDAHCAALLCGRDGPARYEILVEYRGTFTAEFLLSKVLPFMSGVFVDEEPILIWATSLLWAATSSAARCKLMPSFLKEELQSCVRQALNISSEAAIPLIVRRVPLMVQGSGE